MKYQFILHDKDIVRFTSHQSPIPCFKPRKTSLVVTCRAGFSNFAWLRMFLTEFALICRSLFRYCGARGKFLTLKNIVIVY